MAYGYTLAFGGGGGISILIGLTQLAHYFAHYFKFVVRTLVLKIRAEALTTNKKSELCVTLA